MKELRFLVPPPNKKVIDLEAGRYFDPEGRWCIMDSYKRKLVLDGDMIDKTAEQKKREAQETEDASKQERVVTFQPSKQTHKSHKSEPTEG